MTFAAHEDPSLSPVGDAPGAFPTGDIPGPGRRRFLPHDLPGGDSTSYRVRQIVIQPRHTTPSGLCELRSGSRLAVAPHTKHPMLEDREAASPGHSPNRAPLAGNEIEVPGFRCQTRREPPTRARKAPTTAPSEGHTPRTWSRRNRPAGDGRSSASSADLVALVGGTVHGTHSPRSCRLSRGREDESPVSVIRAQARQGQKGATGGRSAWRVEAATRWLVLVRMRRILRLTARLVPMAICGARRTTSM